MNDETKVQSDQENECNQLMPETYDQLQKLIDLHPYQSVNLMAQFASFLEEERDEARDAAEKAKAFKRVLKNENAKLRRERDEARDDTRNLLRQIFNLTQIGDPHPADLPMRALQAIAEMIDEHLKEARNGSER